MTNRRARYFSDPVALLLRALIGVAVGNLLFAVINFCRLFV